MGAFAPGCRDVEVLRHRDAEEFLVDGPRFAGEYGYDLPKIDTVTLKSPQIDIFEFKNTAVMGGTNLAFHDKDVLYPDVVDPDEDMFTAEIVGEANYLSAKRELQIISTGKPCRVDRAISLLGDCTGNYAHWLLETLPRLTIINELGKWSDHKLLVDGWIHPVFFETIALADVACREIVRVSRFCRVECNHLVYVSPPSYTAPENRTKFRTGARPAPSPDTYLFSPKDMEAVRRTTVEEACRYVLGTAVTKPLPNIFRVGHARQIQVAIHHAKNDANKGVTFGGARRVYLRRTSISSGNPRHLVGDQYVETLLADYGFLAVDAAALPFPEQVLLLRDAECVVAPLGASLANLIFAPPGVKVIGLAPYYKGADYFYFSNLMGLLGHKLKYVLGPQLDQAGVHWLHRDYRVNLKALQGELDAIFGK